MTSSSRIKVPGDRTPLQRPMGYCRNPDCRESGTQFEFEVKHDPIECPKCRATLAPMVGLLQLIHLLIPDLRGPVRGSGGLRYAIACRTKRAYLATATNQEAATDQIQIANCPGCVEAARRLNVKKPLGQSLVIGANDK